MRPAGGAHPVVCVGDSIVYSIYIHPSIVKGTLYWKKHRPSDETLNRGPDSLWSLKIPDVLRKRVGVLPRHPGQTSPLAS